MLKIDIEEIISRAKKSPCILCGGQPDNWGVFVPDGKENQGLYGAPAGKTRALFYSLCDSCKATPGCLDRVENIMLLDIRKAMLHEVN
jgi:hypothetical protein